MSFLLWQATQARAEPKGHLTSQGKTVLAVRTSLSQPRLSTWLAAAAAAAATANEAAGARR